MRSIFAVLCLGQLAAGCGWLDEDTPDRLDFALPTLTWKVSTKLPQWRQAPGSDVAPPNFVCAGPLSLSTDCCASPVDCQKTPFACDPTTNLCTLTFDVEIAEHVQLARVPAIAEVRGRVFSKVDLLDLSASAVNADDLPIRAAALFLGAEDLATSAAPSATFLVSVALIAEPQTLTPEASARQTLSTFLRDYETPFSLLLSLHVVVPNKTTPTGEFDLTLNGHARAYY